MRTPRGLGGLPLVGRPDVPHAVIDLGAGAFHLTQAGLGPRGQIRGAVVGRRPVRMLEPLRTGHLDDASWGVAKGTLGALAGAARREPDAILLAVASSWFGELDNGAEFLTEARGCLGVPVEVLTPREEARLVWAAARRQAPCVRGPLAVLSIGASSVQLAVGLGEMCLFATSLPIGALRLRACLLPTGRPLEGDGVRAVMDAVLGAADGAAKELRAFRPVALLLAGGTCRALGRLGRALPEGPGGPVLGRRDAESLVALLSGRGADAVTAQGLGRDRADSLGPAAVVLSSLLAILGIEEGVIVRAGLREGVLLRERGHDECQ